MRYTTEILGPVVASSKSVAEVMRKLGLAVSGSSHKTVTLAITRLGIDKSHFGVAPTIRNLKPKMQPMDVLVANKTVDAKRLRGAMLESGFEYKCVKCGIGPTWCDEPLVLQVEHKNGDHRDCRPSNVEFRCPNCHSQTPTWGRIKTRKKCGQCGKPINKRNNFCLECVRSGAVTSIANNRFKSTLKDPGSEVLSKMVWEFPTTTIAKRYGVSDKAVEKWCKKHGIAKPGPGYWQKRKTTPR